MIKRCICGLLLATSALAQFPGTPAATKSKVPPLNVQPAVGFQRRPEGNSFYRKTMDINPKLTLAGNSSLLPIPALEATMIIVTMDTQAKYVSHKEKLSVFSAETIQIPAASNGSSRTFTFASSQTSFDSYRDTSNVGGQVYKFYIFGVRDPDTHEVIKFETSNTTLSSICLMDKSKQDTFLALKKGGDVPEIK